VSPARPLHGQDSLPHRRRLCGARPIAAHLPSRRLWNCRRGGPWARRADRFLWQMSPARLAAALLMALGCGSYSELPPAQCTGAPGAAHAVTCPGVPGCVCAAPQACCLGAIDATAGSCESPRACAGVVLSCDGPEDCSGGVCCLTLSGSSCSATNSCPGTRLCRDDSQCAGSGASHCLPADFGQPGVNDRGLDGKIGLCRQ
jgi:hypothetical protein